MAVRLRYVRAPLCDRRHPPRRRRRHQAGAAVVAIVLFVAHGLLSLVTRSFDRFWPRDVLSAALWLGCFVVAGVFVVTLLALHLKPPVTPDGHRLMPIGQMMVGIVAGGALGTGVAVFGSLRPRYRSGVW